MWHLAQGLDWETIAQMSNKWANRYELTLAKDFVEHLDALPKEGETGRMVFEVDGTDAASQSMAVEVKKAIRHKLVLGLLAEIGIPARPEGPAVACRVKLTASEALVQVASSDGAARNWIPFGKFSLPLLQDHVKRDTPRFVDELTEGILNRLVRVQLSKGVKDKGRMHYQIRIDNASPWILNGLAALETVSKQDETPRVLWGICVSPRRSLTVPASEEGERASKQPECPRRDELRQPRGTASASSATTRVFSELFFRRYRANVPSCQEKGDLDLVVCLTRGERSYKIVA